MEYKISFDMSKDPIYNMWLGVILSNINTSSSEPRLNLDIWLDSQDLGLKYVGKNNEFIRTYLVTDMKKFLLTKIRYAI